MTHLSNTIRLTPALLASIFLPLIPGTAILPLLRPTHISRSLFHTLDVAAIYFAELSLSSAQSIF